MTVNCFLVPCPFWLLVCQSSADNGRWALAPCCHKATASAFQVVRVSSTRSTAAWNCERSVRYLIVIRRRQMQDGDVSCSTRVEPASFSSCLFVAWRTRQVSMMLGTASRAGVIVRQATSSSYIESHDSRHQQLISDGGG